MRELFLKKGVKRPVLPMLASYIAGLIVGDIFGMPLWVPALIALSCLCLIVWTVCRRRRARILPIVFFMALGVLGYRSLFPVSGDEAHIFNHRDKGLLVIRGIVESEVRKAKGRQTFIVCVSSVTSEDGPPRQVAGNLRVTFAGAEPCLYTGDSVELKSRIKPFRNFYNPGGFDYERYMAFNDTWGSAYARRGMLRVIGRGKAGVVEDVRKRMETFLDRSLDDDKVRGVLKALVTGNRNALPPALTEAFRKTGTAHLLAISGLHVGIIAGVSFAFLSVLLSWVPALAWSGRVRKTAALVTIGPVLFYGLISGMSPSTQRAVAMVVVVLLAYSVQAEHDITNTLALSALLILAVSPGSLFGVSFQLSFAAVLFIVWGMATREAARTCDDDSQWSIKGAMASYAWVSFFAYAATLPLSAHYFNQVSLIGFFVNVVLVPVVGFLVIPLGLSAMAVFPLSVLLAETLIRLAGFVLSGVLWLIQSLSELPYASVRVVTPSLIELGCYYALFALFLILVSRWKERGRRRVNIVLACMALIGLIIMGDVFYWVLHRYFHQDLRVSVLDVGQGSANLVEFPGGRCMLIDGGGFSDNSTFDMGEKVLAPVLWAKKIARVDTVVLTHPESDHLNGLLYILTHFKVNELWFDGPFRATLGCKKLKEIIQDKGIRVKGVKDLEGSHEVGEARVRVLWPPLQGGADYNDFNNRSLVLKIRLGKTSFLFPGDIMEKAETDLTNILGDTLESSVLIVPHHGSKTSSTQAFVDGVNPDYAVISAGYKNRFKMPHKTVLQRYQKQGAALYRTDLQGAVLVNTDGQGLHISTVCE